MLIPVISGDIQIESVCDCLREHGLVVIETTSTHAKSIAAETINRLEITEDPEDGERLIHLATEVGGYGHSDFLMYTRVYDRSLDETEESVVKAVLSWIAAGSPNIHIANVCP
ncbi:MAG: hypothetical protein ACYC0P_01910 [Thiobacillus sp.]